jgi:hypothetical protein
LELRDVQYIVAGRLIVELRESDAVQAGHVAASAAKRDITERGIAAPNPMRDSVGDALGRAASAGDVANPLATSLKRVLEKTKIIVDFIDKTAKVGTAVAPLISSVLVLSTTLASPLCLRRVECRLFRI